MPDNPNVSGRSRAGQALREKLPVHPHHDIHFEGYVLRVDGLVQHCLDLTSKHLERLPQHHLTQDFTCLEGWTVPDVQWSGVLLEAVLALADPRADARYVQASAGDFSLPLSREEASRALLAIRLGGDAVPVEHGGPVRLIVPSGHCFMQIKWLNHLELCREAGANTAKSIALGRLPSISTTQAPEET
jgi:DMSO/TMAO reductase YedYZ molybdopterin-dependent catalytic subunit